MLVIVQEANIAEDFRVAAAVVAAVPAVAAAALTKTLKA
jgi:hypothetical protein